MDLMWYAVIGVFLFTMYDEFTGHGGAARQGRLIATLN